MSDRGTRLYVSAQEILASKAAPEVPEKSDSANRLRLPSRLQKIDQAEKKAVSKERNTNWEKEDAGLPLQSGSPWKRYREILALLDLGDKVVVACERNAPGKHVNIRRFPRDEKEAERLSWFRNMRHANIVSVLEIFAGQRMLYVVLEQMQAPIDHLIRCLRQPSADEIGTIIGQVSRQDPATS